jgi:hypothetical protein
MEGSRRPSAGYRSRPMIQVSVCLDPAVPKHSASDSPTIGPVS